MLQAKYPTTRSCAKSRNLLVSPTLKFYLVLQVETDSGTLIPEVSGILQYRITKDTIGKFISFKCIPVRDDGTVGEPKACMGTERVRSGDFSFP